MLHAEDGDPRMLMARHPRHVSAVDVDMAEQRAKRLHAATMRLDQVYEG
jgi:hypothetical protein